MEIIPGFFVLVMGPRTSRPRAPGIPIMVVCLALVFGTAGLWAEEKEPDYVFTYSASLGVLYGQGEEIVYKTSGEDRYLSELLWDLKPLFYHQSALDFGKTRPLRGPGFWGSLSLRLGIPAGSGNMEDRDWLNRETDF